ncbi:UvrD-helicase domain-containing protein [Myxococcota bacterium]|nr:UvrD-helicase domain-containing protein [Myxococcota bacterium]
MRVENASFLDGLNPEQRRAVETTEGPLLVLAGAGSGKTRVLTHRIAYLMGTCGIPPEGVLAVTFTNKAAGEMRERVEKLLGPQTRDLWVGTFHSTCVRILRREISHLGYSRGFAIYDEADSLSLVKEAITKRGLDPKVVDPRRIRWRIDAWKNDGMKPAAAAERATDIDDDQAADIYAQYQRLLADANALDFGDLLVLTVELFERFPRVLAHYASRWQYILVDEYQDTNRVQYRLIRQLTSAHGNLCVVGDPDQSIYGWRGADIRNILDFEEDYPETEVVRLERNYRSTQPILTGATGVVSNNLARKRKDLYTDREGGDQIRIHEAATDRDEAQFVVGEILASAREGDRSYQEFAIFYRTNAQSRLFEEELLKYDVPHEVVGGVRFYERAEVKDALCYLRLVINPRDTAALRRVVNRPTRGIGRTTVERAELEASQRGETLLEGFRVLGEGTSGVRSAAKVRAFIQLYELLVRECTAAEPADALAIILDRSGYMKALEKDGSPEAEGRIENLRELLTAAEDFSRANADSDDDRTSIEIFLDQVALVSDLDAYAGTEETVSLMTVHNAKGLEFPVVFLVGLEERIFPHSGSMGDEQGLEEERRLCYVGMTRAMQQLNLTSAAERVRYGSRNYGVPSRFLDEIPQEVVTQIGSGRKKAARSRSGGGHELDYSYAQEPASEGGDVRPGLRVVHPVFGAGTVVSVSGNGLDQKLKIQFERAGIKTILVRYANLELG